MSDTIRMARCAYYGRRTAKRGSYGGGNECNYGQREAAVCTCEQPSEIGSKPYPEGLPFFQVKPHAAFDEFYCGCQGWD